MIFGMKTCPAREIGYDCSADAEPPAIPGKRATSFLPFFLVPPVLVAPGRSADRSQQVFFSEKPAATSCSAHRSQPVLFSEKLSAPGRYAPRSQPSSLRLPFALTPSPLVSQ